MFSNVVAFSAGGHPKSEYEGYGIARYIPTKSALKPPRQLPLTFQPCDRAKVPKSSRKVCDCVLPIRHREGITNLFATSLSKILPNAVFCCALRVHGTNGRC